MIQHPFHYFNTLYNVLLWPQCSTTPWGLFCLHNCAFSFQPDVPFQSYWLLHPCHDSFNFQPQFVALRESANSFLCYALFIHKLEYYLRPYVTWFFIYASNKLFTVCSSNSLQSLNLLSTATWTIKAQTQIIRINNWLLNSIVI